MSLRIRDPLPGRRRRLKTVAAVATPAVAALGCVVTALPAAAASHPQQHSRHPAAVGHAKHAARAASPKKHRLTVGRVRYRKGARDSDPAITVNIGGTRTGSANEPGGVAGVWFRAVGNTVAANTASCVTDAAGTCTMNVTSEVTQSYTVEPDPAHALPANWAANPELGIFDGSSVPATNPGTTYDSVTTPSLTPTGGATVPVALNTTAITSRGNRIAFTRHDTPDPRDCGLNVGLLVDLSSSITAAGVLQEYRNAAESFVTALQGTPSSIAVHTFGTDSPAASGTVGGTFADNSNVGLKPVATATEAQDVKNKIQQLNVVGAQWTNWDAGLDSFVTSGERYDVVVVLTDGDPTRYGRPTAAAQPGTGSPVRTRFLDVENGIFSANGVKALPGSTVTHPSVQAVGVTTGAPVSPGSQDNLRAISGPGDYYTTNFADLGGVLRSLAREQCEGTVSVVKHVVPHDGDISEAQPGGSGWHFTSSNPAESKDTDDTSSVNFDTRGETTPTTITAHERDGYEFMHDQTHCHIPGSSTPVHYTQNNDGVTVTPNPDEPITCDVYNRAPAPQAILSIEKHASPATFTHVGERIEYTYKVTNHGNVGVEDLVIHDDKVHGTITHCDSRTLEPGESTFCHAVYEITQQDVDNGYVHNLAFAAGEEENGTGNGNGNGGTNGIEAVSPDGGAEVRSMEVPVTG